MNEEKLEVEITLGDGFMAKERIEDELMYLRDKGYIKEYSLRYILSEKTLSMGNEDGSHDYD